MNRTHASILTVAIGTALLAGCEQPTDSSATAPATEIDAQYAAARIAAPTDGADVSAFFTTADLGGATPSANTNLPTTTAARATGVAARAMAGATVDSTVDPVSGWFVKTWTNGSGWTKTDSVKAVPSDLAKPIEGLRATRAISVLENRGPAGRLLWQERSELFAEGDTFFVGRGPADQKYRIGIRRADILAATEAGGELVGTSGVEGRIFDDADNKVVSWAWGRLRGTDTLSWASAKPLNSAYLKGGTKDTTLFAIDLREQGPLGGKRQAHLLVVAAHGDTAIVGATARTTTALGRIGTLSLTNQAGDSLVRHGDTALVRVTNTWPAGDSLSKDSVAILVDPGTGFGRADNRVLAVSASQELARGIVSRVELDVTSVSGWHDGQSPKDGVFHWEAFFRDGTTAKLDGQFTATGMKGTWSNRHGDTTSFTRN